MYLIRNIFIIFLLTVLAAGTSACGKKGGQSVESGPDQIETDDQDPTEDDLRGGSNGEVGVTQIETETADYQVVVTVGEPVPVAWSDSESGNYRIISTTRF